MFFVHFSECFAELFVFILCEEYFMLRALQAKEPCNAKTADFGVFCFLN